MGDMQDSGLCCTTQGAQHSEVATGCPSSAELTAAIVALATPPQRAHAAQKLDDLIRDFTELSQET